MSRNGTGTYNLPAGNPVVTGTVIASTWANSTLTDIASALTGSVASDGQTPMVGDLDMNSNKIVNLEDPVDPQDAATKAYVTSVIPDTANFLLKTNNLSDVTNASTSRTNLGLGSIATQAASAVAITGGSITGITDLAVADGGTGASSFTANTVLLGNGTSALQTVAPSTTGNLLTSNGTTWISSPPPVTGLTGTYQIFSANGTYTVPSGVTKVVVYVAGGGGGGGGGSDSGGGVAGNGTDGGSSSFGSYVTCAGAYGGRGGNNSKSPVGTPGAAGGTPGGTFRQGSISNLAQTTYFGSGGGGGAGNSGASGTGGGTNWAVAGGVSGLTSGGTVSVTVGAGGAGGAQYDTGGAGGAGVAGFVLITW